MNRRTFTLLFALSFLGYLQASKAPTHTPPSSTFRQKITQGCHSLANEGWEITKIMSLSSIAAALYGIAHDQVTVRVCKEYFTKGFHETNVGYWPSTGYLGTAKNILQTTQSPTAIACTWGIVATLEMGILCGVLLSMASRLGKTKKHTAKDLVKPIATGMAITGACSALALGFPMNPGYLSSRALQGVPEEKIEAFCRCTSAHTTAYAVGALTMLGAALYSAYKRYDATEHDDEIEKLTLELAALKEKQLSTSRTPEGKQA